MFRGPAPAGMPSLAPGLLFAVVGHGARSDSSVRAKSVSGAGAPGCTNSGYTSAFENSLNVSDI